MVKLLAVFLGGGLGSVFRWVINSVCEKHLTVSFPVATLSVNIIGCLILGFFFCFFLDKTDIAHELKLFLLVGFCGGLTTFSTYALEIFKFSNNGEIGKGLIYAGLSVILSFGAIIVGAYLAKQFN